MMQKDTLAPRILTLALSIFVAAGVLCGWTGLAAAEENGAMEIVGTESPASDEQDKAENPTEKDKADKPADKDTAQTPAEKDKPEDKDKPAEQNKAAEQSDKDKAEEKYTLTLSGGEGDKAKTEQNAYDDKSYNIAMLDFFKKFYSADNTDGLTFTLDPEGASEHVALDDDKKITVSGTFEDPITITFQIPDDEKTYPVTISCDKGEPWKGKKTAEGEAIYGQSGEVDLSECLPENKSKVKYGTPQKDDKDSVLSGTPEAKDGKLSFKFVNDKSKVGKTAKVTVPVTLEDDSYAPYEIVVTLTVLDKKEQKIEAKGVEGTVGDKDKSIDASTTGDGELSYEVVDGDNCVEVDEDGNLTLKEDGEATVRVTASETDEYKAATTDVKVKVNPKPTYTVTVKVDDDANGSAAATPYTGNAGTTVKLTATPKDGYEFDTWEVISGDILIADKAKASTSFEMPESDVEVKAHFKKKADTRTITFKANGGSGTMKKQTAEKGSTITLNANKYKRTGYTFTGWNTKKDGTGSSFKDKAKVKLNANATLYAQWKKNDTNTNKNGSSKKSSSSSSSGSKSSSSSSLAQTDDPTNYGLITALAVGGVALVGFGLYTYRKRGKNEAEDENEGADA